MKTTDELRGELAAVEERLVAARDNADVTPEAFDADVELRASLKAEIERSEKRDAAVAEIRTGLANGNVRAESGDGTLPTFNTIVKRDAFEVLANRGAGLSESEYRKALVDGNLRALDGKVEEAANEAHFEKTLKRHASDFRWAAGLLARSRPEYESAWAKLMMGRAELLTNEERAAVAVGTDSQGGYLVPTHLDPTIILTNDGTSNAIRGISRVVTLTEGNIWNGVTSAGVTASFDAELTEVSDDSPTVGTAAITVHKAQAFVQASIEAFQDIAGLSSDVLMLFADARDRLEGTAHATGSGSNQPYGIFTALDANTNVEITSTTAATIGEVDIHSVYRQVPVRWRNRSTWLAHPVYTLAVKRLGTAVSSSYSGDLTSGISETWVGRPVVESDDAPSTQTTTVRDNEIVFGDFSNYVIVDKPGSMSVEFVPHLFNTTTNLPDGRRGWYANWRTGADSVNDVAFRLLQDKTSA